MVPCSLHTLTHYSLLASVLIEFHFTDTLRFGVEKAKLLVPRFDAAFSRAGYKMFRTHR